MDRQPPTMTWVNHASFAVAHAGVHLLCDPWISGRAFDDGWAQYSPTAARSELLESVTHIWISHEHPDHFSPASLRRISPARRAQVIVLYQATADRKVIEFCEGLGFRIREVEADVWVDLAPDVQVMVLPWSSGDSVLALRLGSLTLLNVNDAVVNHEPQLRLLQRRLGATKVDVLCTQFSYANWEGNPADHDRRRAAAAAKLDALVRQVDAFQPTYAVPFASFVWFCHVENDFLNDGVNRVSDAVQAIASRTAAAPIVLYPGETWSMGTPHDVASAVDRYDHDLGTALASAERVTTDSVTVDAVVRAAAGFLDRLRHLNGTRVLAGLDRVGFLSTTTLWLSDLETAVAFDLGGCRPVSGTPRDQCDFALSSSALAFCFQHLYGGDTLNVNGRFQLPEGGTPSRFRRYLQLASLNNRGVSLLRSGPEVIRKITRTLLDRVADLSGYQRVGG